MTNKNLAIFEPFSDLVEIGPLFSRMVERMFPDFTNLGQDSFWTPAIDIEEKDSTIEVKAELPGMKKDDIKVTVRENLLTLSGERKREQETNNKTYHRVERYYGRFLRTIALPVAVNTDKVKAIYKDGVLHVTLTKPETLKPAEIKIETN